MEFILYINFRNPFFFIQNFYFKKKIIFCDRIYYFEHYINGDLNCYLNKKNSIYILNYTLK